MAQDNYSIQAAQAKQVFLGYDQEKLIRKCGLKADETYLYAALLGRVYRIDRGTGDMEVREGEAWQDGSSHREVMTLLDLICDSREDRHLAGKLKNMQNFGHQFHQNLLEDQKDPMAQRIQEHPEAFRHACLAVGGRERTTADISFEVPLFEDLCITVQFWLGDEDFAPRLRYLWDENALQYLRYETMFYAVDLMMQRILEKMQ